MDKAVIVKGLYKSFGSHLVLEDINFSVDFGESLVIVGGSGSGKSVLLKCILGLEQPDKGEIIIGGQNYDKIPTEKRGDWLKKIGVSFQDSALFDSLPIWENIVFGLLNNKMCSRKEGFSIACRELEKVGIKINTATLSPAELSGGMRRRVAFARATVGKPKFLFFDEPTTGLDPATTRNISQLVRELIDDLKTTTITITHDLDSAKIIGDRAVMLHHGKIRWHGKIEDLENSNSRVVREYL